MIEHVIEVNKLIYKKMPAATDMPFKLNYKLGVLLRNLITYLLFKYIEPAEIELDYFTLFESGQILENYICPCGDTSHHWKGVMARWHR